MSEGPALVAKGWRLLRRRGLRYIWYLVTGYLLPRTLDRLLGDESVIVRKRSLVSIGLGVLVIILSVLVHFGTGPEPVTLVLVAVLLVTWATARFKTWRRLQAARAILRETKRGAPQLFTAWRDLPVEAKVRQTIEMMKTARAQDEIRLGRIDNDGRVLGVFGEIGGTHSVLEADFVERYRFPLDIVLKDDKVLVKKDFRRHEGPFVQEWYNLAMLQGKANIPAVYDADETHCILYKNFVPGETIRDILVGAGAKILNVQTDSERALAPLSEQGRLRAVARRGTRLVGSHLSESYLRKLEHQMETVHRSAVAGLSLTFGNVLVHFATGDPWLLDFEGARHFMSTRSRLFSVKRDRDRRTLNRLYGRTLLTRKLARAHLAARVAMGEILYAPVDFGDGISAGRFWSTENGTGRWDFLNNRVVAPLVVEKRVLDLGSHNGAMPMMMLRSGAREVVAVEISSTLAETARLVHRIFEWRDMRSYSLHILNCNMLELLENGWGRFDVVTMFSSLYYLSAEDMARVVRKASILASVVVIQGNSHTRPQAGDNKAFKSSLPFLRELLEGNGFPDVQVYAPRGYARPLLVGRSPRHD